MRNKYEQLISDIDNQKSKDPNEQDLKLLRE